MKSLLESIKTVNESNFDGIVDNIKALFCYDNLNDVQKDIVADLFRVSSNGIIYNQIVQFRKNSEYNSPTYKEFNKSVRMCEEICKALKP